MPFRNLIFDYVLTLSIRIYRFQRFLLVGTVYQRYQFYGFLFKAFANGVFVLFGKILCKPEHFEQQIVGCLIHPLK